MENLTSNLPAIDEAIIATLTETTAQAETAELAAIRAIREKYATLAKHNGFVRIAHYAVTATNWSKCVDLYYEIGGRKARALLTADNFNSENDSQNSGTYGGDRLYLLATGEWLRIERGGDWSQWQGSPDIWGCGVDASGDDHDHDPGGYVRIITDAEVASEYPLADVMSGLANALQTLAAKLPERLVRVQKRAAAASALLTQIEGRS